LYLACEFYLAGFLCSETVDGKVFILLNLTPHHEDVLGEWRCSSTHILIIYDRLDICYKTRPIKVKIKLFLCLIKHHTMKTYWWE